MKYLFLSSLILFGCQAADNSTAKIHEIAQPEQTIDIETPADEEEYQKDSSDLANKAIPVPPKKIIVPEPEEVDLIDDYIRDPFDDPNYIGTPCDDVNGRCTRHNHHKDQNRENNYTNEFVDSLKQ